MKSRFKYIYASSSKTKPWRGVFRLHGRQYTTPNFASEQEAATAVTMRRNNLWKQKGY